MKMAMKQLHLCWFASLICLLVFSALSASSAAETAMGLRVHETGTSLYSRQELDSDKIATLKKGDLLTLLAEAVGQQTWYMVKTADGMVGWVRAVDVSGGEELRQTFREHFKETPKRSTWNAQTTSGRSFKGSWSVDPASSPDKASGTWTLAEASDKVTLRGTWSAQKFSTGWSGTWRAAVDGQRQEFSGSWTADFPQARDTAMAELFLTAAHNAVRGIWSADGDSGSWVIQAAK